ncbi:MAG: type III pantothenate kinase [Chthoniobacterales bacterium]
METNPLNRRSRHRKPRVLLIDNSNSFTKFAVATGTRLGRVHRIPTPSLTTANLAAEFAALPAFDRALLASVVPPKAATIRRALRGSPLTELSSKTQLGVAIDYPAPESIGADRLANSAACAALHGTPAVVVDFGTAVTFDILSSGPAYIGGVIAPGLGAMTHYLHDRTALLPAITLREPARAVGKTTREAMLAGAVHGYRGLIKEILEQIRREAFPRRRPKIVATGGDARLIAGALPLFDVIDPHLTLHGLRIVADLNPA